MKLIEGSIEAALNLDLKTLGYQHDLLLFRGLGQLSNLQMFELVSRFGTPWTLDQYKSSGEQGFKFPGGVLSVFSNETATRLGAKEMPWHVDIPNSGASSFPWRALHIVQNPNPFAGLTSWLDIRLDHIRPTNDELSYFKRLRVLNQSWLQLKGEEYVIQDFIKTHPITGVQSLRANYFVSPGMANTAWIKETYLDGKRVSNLETLGPIYKHLSQRVDLMYTHEWKLHDLIVYDNHSFMHRRTALDLQPGEVREFMRANAHHT